MLGTLSINQKMKAYDDAYVMADYFIKVYNPCKISKPRLVSCWHRKPKMMARCQHDSTTCCGFNCKHLTIKGCGANALGCKLHLCYTLREDKNYIELVRMLDLINQSVSNGWGILGIFSNPFNLPIRCYDSRNAMIKRLRKGE